MEFGLLGQKLTHSFSKGYFSQKFHAEKIDAVYENFELADIDGFKALHERHPKLRGLNVTLPYKEAIVPYLHALGPTARSVRAVNTIHFVGDQLLGHNTDVIGFRDSLAEAYERPPGGKALILGTGGSAKAVRYALQHYFGFDTILQASRTPAGGDEIHYHALQETGLAEYRLIVNCTPVGMHPKVRGLPDLPYSTLQRDCFVFDLVYNPKETRLLAEARKRGCPAQNGMDMLIRQAEASWKIWMG